MGARSDAILGHAFDLYNEQFGAVATPPPATSTKTGSLLERVMGGSSLIPSEDFDTVKSEIERYTSGFDIGFALAENALAWWKV